MTDSPRFIAVDAGSDDRSVVLTRVTDAIVSLRELSAAVLELHKAEIERLRRRIEAFHETAAEAAFYRGEFAVLWPWRRRASKGWRRHVRRAKAARKP